MVKLNEVGTTGLTQQGGVIDEESLRQLHGDRGARTFRAMAENDALIGAILFSVEMLLRNVEWRIEPYSDNAKHREDAEFVYTIMDDMSHSWEDFIAEALSMLVYGWSACEIVYKRRQGQSNDPTRRSRYNDGLIGWRKLPLRSQDTLDRWVFDDDGGIQGFWQNTPLGERPPVFIPIEKMLLFRTTSRKNNPEGRSVLRNAYVSYYHKTRIAEFEAIGVERDLAGIPLFYLPPGLFDPNASPEEKAQLAEFKSIVQNIRNDEQAGLLLPAMFDDNNNRIVDFTLAGTGSRRLFDTNAIIQRYNREMAMTVLADFVLLGHEKVGSYALSSDKTEMFATALGAWLNELSSVLNRHGLPRLFAINGKDTSELPMFVPGDLEKVDIERTAEAIGKMSSAGLLTPGSESDEDWARTLLGMPPK